MLYNYITMRGAKNIQDLFNYQLL